MHSYNDETGIFEVLEIKFSSLPKHGVQFFKDLLAKFFLSIVNFAGVISVKFLKESKNCLKFSFYHYQEFSYFRQKKETVKSVAYHTGVYNWITCLTQLLLSL